MKETVLAIAWLGAQTTGQGHLVRSEGMSGRGVEFVTNWVAKNVTALDPSDDPMRSTNLATRCIVEAAAEGIALEEVQPKTRSLESLIFDAMVHPAEPGKTPSA